MPRIRIRKFPSQQEGKKCAAEIIVYLLFFCFPSSMEQNSDCLPFFTSPLLSFDQMKNHLIVFEPNSAHTYTKSIRSETESNKKVHFYFNLFIVFIFAEFFFMHESNKQIGLWLFRIPQWKSKTKAAQLESRTWPYLDTAGWRHRHNTSRRQPLRLCGVHYGNWNLCPTRNWSFTRKVSTINYKSVQFYAHCPNGCVDDLHFYVKT